MTSYVIHTSLIVDSVAQLVERRSSIPKVVGSNPTGVSDFFFSLTQKQPLVNFMFVNPEDD